MIRSARFQNFKSLRDVSLELEQFTVIVGPNASGKTSILEGIHYLSQLPATKAEQLFRAARHPLLIYTRNAQGPIELECSGVEKGLRQRIDPPLDFPDDRLHPQRSDSASSQWTFHHIESREIGIPTEEWRDRYPGRSFSSAVLLRLDATRLSAASYSETPRPRVEYDGKGLASVLAHMALNQPEEFHRLQVSLREVVPSVQQIRFDRQPVYRVERRHNTIDGRQVTSYVRRKYWGDSIIVDMEGAPDIPASQVSEGTMLAMGLLAVLVGPARPRLILLDDLDRALHPKAQRELVSLLRTFLEKNPDTQIVATTHSPYLLDEVKGHEVRLTTLGPDGSTVCRQLDQHPEFDEWKNEMRPGEFWSVVGENWAINSSPMVSAP